MKTGNEVSLRKNLTQSDIWSLAFGCIIGFGAFINPGRTFLPESGTLGTAIAMLLGALIIIIISFSYAYMIPKYPKAGGEFTFAREFFGKKAAYICGWFLAASYISIVPLNATALGLVIHGLFGPVLKIGFHYKIAGFDIYAGEMIFMLAVLLLFGIFSIISVRTAGRIQTFLAMTLVLSVFALTIGALLSSNTSINNLMPLWGFDVKTLEPHESSKMILNGILSTLVIAPWAFVGFDTVPQAAEELNFPHRKVKLIMLTAILFGGFVYIANNTVTASAFPDWPKIIAEDSEPWLLLTAAEKLLGIYGRIFVGAAVFCAVLTGIMGFYMASSRLIYSMSIEGYLPEFLGRIDSRTGTPRNAIIFCMIVSFSGPVLGREALGWFVDMSSAGASIGFGFTCAAAFMLSLKEKKRTAAVFSLLGVIFSCMFIFLQIVPVRGLEGVHLSTEAYIMLAVWTVLGLVFYMYQFNGKK